jgi:basic membrane protein A
MIGGLAACALPGRDCARPQVICVGLVTNTAGLDDHGMAASAWAGIQKAVQDGLVQQADVIESVDTRDYSKNIATFAGQGYDLIITSGQGMSDETLEQAILHPEVQFVGLDQDAPGDPLENLYVMIFPEEQGGFLAGALAAKMSHTGAIGAVCETKSLESMRRSCEGFRAGAAYQNKQVKVFISYHEGGGSGDLFNDEAWGAETAREMVRDGADVIYGVGGRLGEAALQAATEAGAWIIGSERDQYYITREARKGLLTSIIPDASEALYQFVAGLEKGRAIPPLTLIGRMTLAPYHDGGTLIPLAVQQSMLSLETALNSGKVNVSIEEPR